MSRLSVLAFVLFVAVGCGYRSDNLFRANLDSVHVEIFESRTFRRDLEFQLTEAVKKRIGVESPYRLAGPEAADTVLTGEILEQRQASFAPDFLSRQPRDIQMTMIVRVEWKDLRSGEILFNRDLLLQAVDYLPPTGESERYTQQKALDKLASRIVRQMYRDW